MIATDTNLVAIHRAILADPADDVPRLAYADRLEEIGNAQERLYAELIRVQLDGETPLAILRGDGKVIKRKELFPWKEKVLAIGKVIDKAVFGNWGMSIYPMEISLFHPRTKSRFIGSDVSCFSMQRGFVAHAEISCKKFMKHARELFSKHPITSVELIGKHPANFGPHRERPAWIPERLRFQGSWSNDSSFRVPSDILYWLPKEKGAMAAEMAGSFVSEAAALAALSAACVAYGRNLAGLPFLETRP